MRKRLDTLLEMIPRGGLGLIDVGTDHGWIPIRLAESGYAGRLYASDIREGPLQNARRAAEAAGLGERIEFLLCDGLDLCPREAVDCILIAGMGGDTICGILDRAEWVMDGAHRLVLQPMTKPEVLRYWLIHNEFRIDREEQASEEGHLYQCFSACIGQSESMSDAEYLIGALSPARPAEEIMRLAISQRSILEKKLHGFRTAGREEDPEYRFYSGICRQLDEIVDKNS